MASVFYLRKLRDQGGEGGLHRGQAQATILQRTRSVGVRVEFVADRFVVCRPGLALDLATGAQVALSVSTAGARPEHARWKDRCARLASLWHPRVATLVDYGPIGEVRRFEAWRSDGLWDGPLEEARTAVAHGTAFLHANGLTVGERASGPAGCVSGRAVYVPDATAGYECGANPVESIEPLETVEALGLCLLPRRPLSAITDLFDGTDRGRPRALAIWGPAGAGMDTVLLELAREARRRGFVPVSPEALFPECWPLLRGRSMCIIARRGPLEGWRALLNLSTYAPKAHVLLFAGDWEVPTVLPIVLERFSPDTLASAVRPASLSAPLRRRVDVAAARSQGLPGRFAALLWPRVEAAVPRASDAARVAEGVVAYGSAPDAAAEASPREPAPRLWPAPGEMDALRRRLTDAVSLLEAGHHARGERLLRQAVGGLARRHDWASATQGTFALARALLVRGRSREAQAVLDHGHQYAGRVGDAALMVQLAILSGRAAVDSLHLEHAEAVLRAAVAASRGMDQGSGAWRASLELARCLCWRGRWEEAGTALASVGAEGLGDDVAVRLAILRSRVALGKADLPAAVASAAVATGLAAESATPAHVAAAAYAEAMAHLAVGDHRALHTDFSTCLGASRAAREPLLALRARLLAAEGDRRLGRTSAGARLVRRMRRVGRHHVPAIVWARVDLLADLIKDGRPEVVARHSKATGLGGLTAFGPPPRPSVAPVVLTDLLEILRCCQTAEEGDGVLLTLSAELRGMLRAAAVGCFVDEGGRLVLVASDGGRIEVTTAARLYAAREHVAPSSVGPLESGVIVRCGGRVVGAVIVRWAEGDARELPESANVLATAAIAAAPAFADALARRARPLSGCPELLGASPAMDDVRRTIERSAQAPFSVLIEGESGSGKELVARALHRGSLRREGPYCSLNCAALPDDLIESELFGHARGAFTGAVGERPGVFEAAHLGTLFLDEVGELSLRAQAKVLRAIQEGEIRRVGENAFRRVDARIVAATNRDLRHEVTGGRFRLDLLYRLDVIRIVVPPLRDRRDDIPILAEHFWREAATRVGSRATLAVATLGALARYDWPGNVRELQNVLAALAVRCARRGVVPPSALPHAIAGVRQDRPERLDQARRAFEASFIRSALARAGGQRTRAAEALGVSRQGLTKLMGRLGLADAGLPLSSEDSA